jgi:hypothetical protein
LGGGATIVLLNSVSSFQRTHACTLRGLGLTTPVITGGKTLPVKYFDYVHAHVASDLAAGPLVSLSG